MAPIHADEVNGAIPAVTFQERKSATQEIEELGLTHLTGRHRKFAVTNRSLTAHISVNLHVIRRIRENNVSLLVIHEGGVGRFIESVAAYQTMITQQPNVSRLRNRWTRADLYRFFLDSFFCGFLQNQVNFRYLKA